MAVVVRRRFWKPWNWSLATWSLTLLALVACLPFAMRCLRVWQVADAETPFDLQEFVGDEVPREADALAQYGKVMATLGRMEMWGQTPIWLESSLDRATRPFDVIWDDRLDRWLIENSSLLAEFELASRLERAQLIPRRTLHLADRVDDTSKRLQEFVRIPAAEALRSERAGEVSQAWKWHRAILRSSVHAEMPGLADAVNQGRMMRINAYAAVSRWAQYPKLEPEELQAARADLRSIAAKRMSLSDVVKTEYVMIKNSFDHGYAPYFLERSWSPDSSWSLTAKQLYLWMRGEPEVSLRLHRHWLTNVLPQIDRPRHQRPPLLRAEYPEIFAAESKQDARGVAKVLQLQRFVEGAEGRRLDDVRLFSSLGRAKDHIDLDQARRLDNTHVGLIDVVLAAHEYQRIHGEFPRSLDQLVPDQLKAVPFDPMSASGASLRYRRQSNGDAIIWSVGFDGIDDGGDVDGNDTQAKERAWQGLAGIMGHGNPTSSEPQDVGYRIQVHGGSAPQSVGYPADSPGVDGESSK